MPLSWNEIRSRAIAFSKEWGDETSERAEAQSFWNAFFTLFGIDRRRVTAFEKQVGMSRAGHALKNGRIDAFWKGVLLIEHKSAGQNLERVFAQAVDYFDGLPERDLPRYVLVSDFRRLRLSDFETGEETEFALKDLHKHIRRFGFIAGYQAQVIKPQDPVNLRAAERMGRLHDALEASGYDGHALEVMLVRLLFCLFADDTGIFQPAQAFRAWVEERTTPDGSDLGPQLAALFQVLDTPEEKRPKTLDEQLRAFPYVNGRLFEAALPLASFNAVMREGLLDACAIDWSAISPAIFGALFQSIMDAKARRNLGAHYTSEENILKLIKPLFLDEPWAEFEKVKGNRNRLFEFHKKLRTRNFLDPPQLAAKRSIPSSPRRRSRRPWNHSKCRCAMASPSAKVVWCKSSARLNSTGSSSAAVRGAAAQACITSASRSSWCCCSWSMRVCRPVKGRPCEGSTSVCAGMARMRSMEAR